jgi:hypothetical protein
VVVTRTLRVASSLALAALLACSAPPSSPSDVALAYFRDLGRDPIRTLPLLTRAFHAQHGLHVVSAAEARALREGPESAVPPPEGGGDWSLDRRVLGWLEVQSRDGFRVLRDRLQVSLVDASTSGDHAVVILRIQPGRGSAFEQRFELVRDGGRWRIDGVEQRGMGSDNAFAAFVAHPTEAERRRLEHPGAVDP